LSTRSSSFGEDRKLTFVDKFGIWLSNRKIVGLIKKHEPLAFADIGCGHEARLSQSVRPLVNRCLVVDVALHEDLLSSTDYESYVGELPNVLLSVPDESIDFVVLNSVLEHLDLPIESLGNIRNTMKTDGILFVNVPTWLGKKVLEFLAFKMSLSPTTEMEDHRRYYNKKELWLELRTSGFSPSKIKIRRHKFGTNVYAIVKK